MTRRRYTYYPGCSAEGVGRAFTESLYAVFTHLDAELEELEDWNCCGATAWPSVDQDQAFALAARNLAIAERRAPGSEPVDLVASCTGCYRALIKAEEAMVTPGERAERLGGALGAIGLRYEGRARTRHPVDILLNEIGVDRIRQAVVRPLTGVKVASYYGCQLVRPFATFDDPRDPTSMDRLVEAIGAEPIEWPLKARCCGGSCYCGGPVIGAMPEATMQLSYALLREAGKRGADVIATICPLCQFNLEGFQGRMAKRFDHPLDMPVVFITQLLGIALGIDEKRLGVRRLLRWRLPEPAASPPAPRGRRQPAAVGAGAGEEGGADARA
ncbi:MAG TPA: CoB--CoM heterodisulfide reductase iron-sulfur subunit B family protein [Actinomycetota bacterium]|jgi:heterodisulfide reductase subunit B|nr:CoB--CoM heterodisulfide reductase iron-sulfur subunit B family protein [Actinomycetota bacterium]